MSALVGDTSATSTRRRGRGSPLTSMDGKVVLITGATAGIGESCAWAFAALNSKLILAGRRGEVLNKLAKDIQEDYPTVKVHCVALDVSNMEAVAALPDQLPEEFHDVDVLVNNAGCALGLSTAVTNDMAFGAEMMNTNVMGVIGMSRAFLPGMVSRNRGHVINMGSTAGSMPYGMGSMYCASKFAVSGFTQCAQADLRDTPIRITHISPGMVGDTEFSVVRFNGDKAAASAVYQDIVALHPDDVADNVVYAATRPAHVQIAELKMFCTNQSGPRDLSRVGPGLGAK